MTTVIFQFEIDQELQTPAGPGCIEGLGLFWQPDGARRKLYYVALGRGWAWFEESALVQCNRQAADQRTGA